MNGGMFKDDHDGERQFNYRAKRRVAAEDRFLEKLDHRMEEARTLIGQMQGEAGLRYYINVRSKAGGLTGSIREFTNEMNAIDYLLRNNYV